MKQRGERSWLPLDVVGFALGLILAGLSTTPSLLPRDAAHQGVITGVCFGVGYVIGVLLSSVARIWTPRPRAWALRAAWGIVLVGGVVAAIPVIAAYKRTQSEQHLAAGRPALDAADLAVAGIVAVAVALALVAVGKAAAAWHRRLAGRLMGDEAGVARRVGVRAAAGLAVGFTAAVVVGGAVGAFAWYTQSSYDAYNASANPGVDEPMSTYRSAGPESALSWENAGHEGRRILGTGPSRHDIASLTKTDAREPIRIYVGANEPGDWATRAAAAVAELDRMHAADRGVVVVAATTGTGWLDPQAIDGLEYAAHGDSALVAMQYSTTESWHSFVFHPGAYRDATRALLTAVHEWWAALPEEDRPRLIVYGLSLGSRAVQDSFATADEMLAFGDGVVLAGTPFGTQINADLTALRDPGSPYVRPVLDAGVRVRWFADGADVQEASGRWDEPRTAYLQHGNDPIVWVGLPIAWSRPPWLEDGQRSLDVPDETRWFPLVTAVQTMGDTAVDLDAPDGEGHRYGEATREAWFAVLGTAGYTAEDLDLIRERVVGADLPGGADV